MKSSIKAISHSLYFALFACSVTVLFSSCFGCTDSLLDRIKQEEAEKQAKAEAERKAETSYRELCRNNDFEAAHEVLDDLYAKYVNHRDERTKQKYYDALDYIFNKEALYLFSLEDDAADRRITYLLTEIPIDGICPSDGMEQQNFGDGKKYIFYQDFVSSYNAKCTQLLDLAIVNGNKEIATKLLSMYKDDIELERKKVQLEGYAERFADFYKSSSKSKEAAKRKYKEAFGK